MKYLCFFILSILSLQAPLILAQDGNEVDEIQCPVYREFDFDNPTQFQYGDNVPDGCDCVEGMEGLNCAFCTDDAPCKAADSSHVCRSDVIYSELDTYKAYNCRLTGTLASMVPNALVSVYANVTAGTVDISAYKRSINKPHFIDCHISGCTFPIGENDVSCETTVCNCGPGQCSSLIEDTIETMLSGKPADMTATPAENGEHLIAIQIEGAPMDIEAICTASACTADATPTEKEVESQSLKDKTSEWKASASLSVLILISLFAGLILIVICTCLPICCQKRRKQKQVNFLPSDDKTNIDTFWQQRKTVLEFHNISRVVTLKGPAAKAHGQNTKTILHNVSGRVESGTLMGIMGPSGAGKSSLLNVLAAVDNGKARNSGQILLNGKVQKRGYRRKVAYVQQDDSLYSTLTVQECVEYSALLRLPNNLSTTEKQAAVWKTLEELRLTHIATNRIGSGGANAGVSGGERKRVSIGMELVAQPLALFLDEPTSGLDAFAANQIMKVLSELAHRNRIVILSIHQPSTKSFMSMDQVLLLGKGRTMYNGSPAEVGQFLESKGFPCPVYESVADHMLEIVSQKENHEALDISNCGGRKLDVLDESFDGDFDDVPSSERRSLCNELSVLFARASKEIFRNHELFAMQMALAVLLALFVGAIFNDVTNDLAGFQNRMGAFYFSLSFFGFASFSSMDIFVKERHIFVRESGSKYYRAFSYFLSKTVLDLFVLRVIPVSVFACIFYWMMGLKAEPEAFVVFWATLVLFNMCAGMFSICISIATSTVGQANLIAAVWFLVMLLFGGFLVNVETMGPWYSWLRFVSIFYYSFELLMTNELTGLLLSFNAPGYPTIPIYGEVFLESVGMKADRQSKDLIFLCCLTVGCCILAYILLLFRVPPSAGKHFRRMQKANRRQIRLTESMSISVEHDSIGAAAGGDDTTQRSLFVDEKEAEKSRGNVTASVLSAGSAASFWSCISPANSKEEYVYSPTNSSDEHEIA